MRPLLIVISAPSGAGKSTLCDMLLSERKDIVYSISCTTRKPRGDEIHAKDYFFLTEQQFDDDVKAGRFLEHAVVHGNKYGTPRSMVADAMASGKSVIMDIDVQGARQIRSYAKTLPDEDLIKSGYVDIFVAPPSMQALRERLEKRGEDAQEDITRRLKNAEVEMSGKNEYRHVIVNDDLGRAYDELKKVLINEAEKKS
jgi:guanylate kinase